MKKLYTLLAAVFITASTFAQAPEKMSYQAVIRDAGDVLISNQPVGMQISILQTTATGTSVYTETHSPTTNVNGLVSIEIGTGSTTDDFSAIDWSAGPYFIKTETDPTGGSTYTITGTTQLLSVPYALHAKTAESVTGTCGLSIGDTYAGGIIFYLDGSGCHGLVAKPTDEAGTYQWSSTVFGANNYSHGIFAGAQNTQKMIYFADYFSSTSPAATKASLAFGGYTDWYLPSLDELDLMFVNLHLQGLGNFNITLWYWSSNESESNPSLAYEKQFSNGGSFDALKDDSKLVRAIRAF